MPEGSVQRWRVLPHLNSVVVAKPLDFVQENVNRNPGGIIESYVRPNLLRQNKSIERTGRKQVHL